MKKVLLLGIFSLLVLSPFRCARAQAGSNTPAGKVIEKSSTGVVISPDERKAPDQSLEAENAATAKNQNTSSTSAESSEAVSNVSLKAASEAQKNYNVGSAFFDAGKLDKAISALKESNKLKPNDPQTQYMLGMVYFKATDYDEAVDSLKCAVRLKPDWAEAYFRLGQAYYVLGLKTQTSETYERLRELNSPLAEKLYQIFNDNNQTNGVANRRSEPAAPTTKQVEIRPVSAQVAPAPLANKTGAIASGPTKVTTKPITTANLGSTAINTATTTDDSALTGVYRVGVGDVLDIQVLNSAPNRSTLYTVIEGGLIDFPLTGGPVPVAGLTTKDIQARITAELKRMAMEESTKVAVAVRQYASHTVIITGLANSPGTKTLRREAVPLYVLLAEAQPHQDAARAVIIRSGASPRIVDLSDSAALNFVVRPGDVINLTARPQDFYYIAGRISLPGQKTFQPGITLFQAFLAAGGLARNNVVELSRETSDGRLATTKFNLNEIKSGKIQDPKLEPGDRIEVVR